MSIYSEVRALGIEIDHHESDLYVKSCAESLEIVKRHGVQWSYFRAPDGSTWIEVPFYYDPFWRGKQ